MPRMKGGVRDYSYDKAYLKKHAKDNAQRKRARRSLEKLGLVKVNDGKDVHHVKGLKGGNGRANLKPISRSRNRSIK